MSSWYRQILLIIVKVFSFLGSILLKLRRKKSSKQQYPDSTSTIITGNPHIILPGGGIYFFWQAGVVSFLREKNYDVDNFTFSGASAGSLIATLTATNVDFKKATEIVIRLLEDYGACDRPLGLQGIWGEMVETFLDELLPEDAVDRVGDRLSLLVTHVPSFRKHKISSFESRSDLIKTNMASLHIPWFMDGNLTTFHRGKYCMDGAFLSKARHYDRPRPPRSSMRGSASSTVQPSLDVTLDWREDPFLADKPIGQSISAVSSDFTWELLARGRKYASIMEDRGDFRGLPMQV